MAETDDKLVKALQATIGIAPEITKALEKIIDSLGSAVTWIDHRFFAEDAAKRRARAAIIDAEGRGKVAQIEASTEILVQDMRERKTLVPSFDELPKALVAVSPREERMHQRIHALEYQRQTNIENILVMAAEDLCETETKISSDEPTVPPDPDWVSRYISAAQDISSEEMQSAWAKVLSREVTKPGSFSLRTLEVLKNMTRSEAALFQRIAPYVVGESYLWRVWEQKGIFTLPEAFVLSEVGILASDRMLNHSYPPIPNGIFFIKLRDNSVILFQCRNGSAGFQTPSYILQGPGRELLSIIKSEVPKDVPAMVESTVVGGGDAFRRIANEAFAVNQQGEIYFPDKSALTWPE